MNFSELFLFVVFCNVYCLAAFIDPRLDFESAKVVELKDTSASRELPNIRGVRVVVETSKGSPESKSSEADSSDSSSSADRSSIGVRTDVTVEISNESNETISGEVIKTTKNETKEDTDIPIYVGRKVETTWKPLIRIIPNADDRAHTRFKSYPPLIWTTERAQYDPNIPRGKWYLKCCES